MTAQFVQNMYQKGIICIGRCWPLLMYRRRFPSDIAHSGGFQLGQMRIAPSGSPGNQFQSQLLLRCYICPQHTPHNQRWRICLLVCCISHEDRMCNHWRWAMPHLHYIGQQDISCKSTASTYRCRTPVDIVHNHLHPLRVDTNREGT